MGKTFQREVQMRWIQDDLLFHYSKDKGYLRSNEGVLDNLSMIDQCLRSDKRKKLPVTRMKSFGETLERRDSSKVFTLVETL